MKNMQNLQKWIVFRDEDDSRVRLSIPASPKKISNEKS